MSKKRCLAGLARMALAWGLCLSSSPVLAQDVAIAGERLPEHAFVGRERLPLNGAGLRRLYGFKVYVAALYLPRPGRDAGDVLGSDMARALRLVLLRDTTTEQNLDALKDGLVDNNTPDEMRAIAPEVANFLGLLGKLHHVPAGTVIRLDYQPGEGTRLSVGERLLGVVPGARFNRALLKIWLGEAPIQASLKRALLGDVDSLP